MIGAYIYYNTATTKRLKEEEGLSHKDAFAKAGKMWQTATEEEKKPFVEQHEADQKRYDAQMKMLKDKGYFMIDGVKSTDLPHEEKSARKQKAKSGDESKVAKKRASGASVGKSKGGAAAAGKKPAADKTAASGKKAAVSKKSEDDLDIEESEALEASD